MNSNVMARPLKRIIADTYMNRSTFKQNGLYGKLAYLLLGLGQCAKPLPSQRYSHRAASGIRMIDHPP